MQKIFTSINFFNKSLSKLLFGKHHRYNCCWLELLMDAKITKLKYKRNRIFAQTVPRGHLLSTKEKPRLYRRVEETWPGHLSKQSEHHQWDISVSQASWYDKLRSAWCYFWGILSKKCKTSTESWGSIRYRRIIYKVTDLYFLKVTRS